MMTMMIIHHGHKMLSYANLWYVLGLQQSLIQPRTATVAACTALGDSEIWLIIYRSASEPL